MDISMLSNITINVPLVQIAALSLLCSIFAVWGKTKFVLIFVFGFILYWVFILNAAKFSFSNEAEMMHTGLFIITCIVFVGCCAWMFFFD